MMKTMGCMSSHIVKDCKEQLGYDTSGAEGRRKISAKGSDMVLLTWM